MRESGILMPVSSLPGPYGIGCFGAEAVRFVDFLAAAGQTIWQILPLSPTGYGDSPYQSCSAFAGNPYFIDLEALREEGLLTESQLEGADFGTDPCCIDYGALYNSRYRLLRAAYGVWVDGCAGQHGCKTYYPDDYYAFTLANEDWLDDYALFMAGKDYHEGLNWYEWETSLRDPGPLEKEEWTEKLKDQVEYHKFLQFLFFDQWFGLKEYANQKGIAIIGDIPIFTCLDSADVWANRKLFRLDTKGYPLEVAGVPPDYFSATGQLWGNPLYDWDAHAEDGYSWWIERIRNQLDQVDYLRIDHFRGLEAYWAVPAGEETAINGAWKKGPGEDLFLAVEKELGEDLPIFAEDLGIITPEVERLRDMFAFPGMKVLQFGFEGEGESTFLPHQLDTRNCVCYTGTHDNDTALGWMKTAEPSDVAMAQEYLHLDPVEGENWGMMRAIWSSTAGCTIVQMQDLLGLGSESRMNTPSTLGGNWAWRAEPGFDSPALAQKLHRQMELYERLAVHAE